MFLLQVDNEKAAEAAAEQLEKTAQFWKAFQGLSLEDIISKLAHTAIGFAFKVALAVFVFYLGRFIVRKIYGLIKKIMTHRNVDASLTTFVLSLVQMLLYFILVVTIIGILGIETSSFIAIFASAGVAMGMALSGTLQNFAGGVLILLLKPYKVGDYIETQGYSGTVKSIQIFFTIINTPDNKAIILPNGGLSTGTINNYSYEDVRRVEWTVSLSYGTDAVKAMEAILKIVKSDERVMSTQEGGPDRNPFVGLNEMADSSINFVVRAWTRSSEYWSLYFNMNEKLYTQLQEEGFSFPFPQLDVHLSNVDDGEVHAESVDNQKTVG